MKKYKILAYIMLAIAIVILISVISINVYSNAFSYENEDIKKEKALSEIKFLDTSLTNMFNTMNNIEYSSFKLTKTSIKEESSSEGETESSSGGSSSSGSQSENITNKNNVKFESSQTGVLSGENQDINWGYLKNEVESLYTSISTITLDLYAINLNQEDILNFNKKLDELSSSIKDEDKEQTLIRLTQIYSYVPKFALNATDKVEDKKILEVKNDIFLAYADIDEDSNSAKWNDIYNNMTNSIDKYTELLSMNDMDKNKRESINKTYISLNELQNSVKNKNRDTFLIKYKNLMEELSNI